MRAKKVYESLDFERGKDPKDAMGIGSKLYIWDKFLSLRERDRGDWMTYYAIFSSENGSIMKIFGHGPKFKTNTNKILKEMGLDEYIELPGKITDNRTNREISYPIKPQFRDFLKDFQSSDYFGKKSVFETAEFKRGNHPSEILDRLTDEKFRKGRLFTYMRSHGNKSRDILMYLDGDSGLGRFLKVGVVMVTEKQGPFYAFYAPYLLSSSDKMMNLSKDTVREPSKDERDLYLYRVKNPTQAFLSHLEEIKKITGIYPFI